MKKILSFLLVVFLAVTLFASTSCKDDNQSPTSSQTSSVSSESNSSEEGALPSVPSSSATDSKPSSSDSSSSGGTITPTPKPSTEIVGSWTCVSFKVDDTETLSTYSAEGLSFVATFYDDWTCSYGMLQGSKTSFLYVEGTFTVSGNTITAVCGAETYVFTLDSEGFLIQTNTSSSQTSVSKFQKGLIAPTTANKFIGCWDCTSFLMDGENLLYYAGIKASFNVSSSGCTFTMEEGSTSKITYGTYTVDGDSLTFTPSNPSQQPVTFTLNENGKLVCNTTFESASTVITLYRGSLAPVPPMLSSKYLGVWELDKTYENSVEKPNEDKISIALLPDETLIYASESSSGSMDGLEGTYYVSGNDIIWQITGDNIPYHLNDDGKMVVTVQSENSTTTMEFVRISSTAVNKDIVGEYNIYSCFVDGEDQTYSASNIKITLNSNGTATYTTTSGTENGKYFVNGNTVVITLSRYYAAVALNVQANGDLSLTTSTSSQTTSVTWRKNYVAPPALTLSDMVGKWQLKKFAYNGTEQTLSYSETIEFKSDDTVTFTTTSGTKISTQNGTYSLYGTTVNITINGTTVTYTVTDGILFCAQQSGANTSTMQYEKYASPTRVNYAGIWELEKIVVGGQQQPLSVSQNVIINANGTFTIVTITTGDTAPAILNGTYVIGGKTITLTPSRGDALTLQFDGEKLVAFIQNESEEAQGQIVYKKGAVSSSSIVGTYDYVSFVEDGAEKITGDGNYDGTYVFNADGTFTLDETYNGSEESYNGYYVLNGSSLTLLIVNNYNTSHVYLTIDASGNLVELSNSNSYVISQKEGTTSPTDADIVGQWTNVSLLVDGKETIDVDNAMHIEFTADGKAFTQSTYVVSGNVISVTIAGNTVFFILDANGDIVGNLPTVDGDCVFTFKKGDITPASPVRHDVVGTWDSVGFYIDGVQNAEFTYQYTFFDDGTVAYKSTSYYGVYESAGLYEIRLGGVMVYLEDPYFLEFTADGKLYECFEGSSLYQTTYQKQSVVPSPTPSDVVGTWELEKVLLNGTEQAAAYTQTFTFKANDTVKITITSLSGTVTKNGTYAVDGTTINVTVYGSTSTLTLSQGKLVLVQQNGNDTITMIFKSQQTSPVTPTISIAGTYNYTSYIEDGVEKIDTDGYSGKIIFNADDTFSLEGTVDSVTQTYSGNYVVNGTRVIACDSDGVYFEFVIDADKNIVNAFVYEDANNDCHSLIITAKAENSTESQNADFVGSWQNTSNFVDGMENVSPTCSDYSISLAQDGTFTTYSVGSAFDGGTYEVLGNVALATSSDNSWIYTLILDYDGNLLDFIYYYSTEGYELDVTTFEKGDDVSVTPVVPSDIVGTWTSIDDDGEYTFYQDGKATVTFNGNTVHGVYLFKNNEVKVLIDDVISLSLDQNGFLIQGSGSNKNVFKKQVEDFVGSWKFNGSPNLSFTSELTVTDDGEFSWTISTSATESNTASGTYVAYDNTIVLVDSDGNFLAIMYIDGSDELTCYYVSSGVYAFAVHERQPNALLSEIVGAWDLYRYVDEGVDQLFTNVSYTFNNDGTVVETYNGVTSNGTFTILGNVISITGISPYELPFVYTAEKTLEQLDESGTLLIFKKNSPSSLDVVGTWNCIEYKVNGTVKSSDISAEFKSDGTLVWSELGDSMNGTYSVSGNVVTITVLNNTVSFTLGANETMSGQNVVSGDTISLILQKEFSFIGTWNCISFKVDGTENPSSTDQTIIFLADNTLTLIDRGNTLNGTYTVENGVATVIVDGATLVFTPNPDRTIYYTFNSAEGTFKKQTSTSTSDALVGTWTSTEASYYYVFNADGTFTITNSSTSLQGTYVLSGNSVTMTANGRTQTATLNTQGDLIEGEYTFKKQGSTSTSLADVIVGYWAYADQIDTIIFKFNADGSSSINVYGNVHNGTYVVSGNTVTVTSSGNSMTLTLTVQGDLYGDDITFKKQTPSIPLDKITGCWIYADNDDVTLTFDENGKATINSSGSSYNGTYDVVGDMIVVTIENMSDSFIFKLNGAGDLIEVVNHFVFTQQTSLTKADVVGEWIINKRYKQGEKQYIEEIYVLTIVDDGYYTVYSGDVLVIDGQYELIGSSIFLFVDDTDVYGFTLSSDGRLINIQPDYDSDYNLITIYKKTVYTTNVVGTWGLESYAENGSTKIIDYTENIVFRDNGTFTLTRVYLGNDSTRNYYGTYVTYANVVTLYDGNNSFTHFTIDKNGNLIEKGELYSDVYFIRTYANISSLTGTWNLGQYFVDDEEQPLTFTQKITFNGNGTFTMADTSSSTFSLSGTYLVNNSTIKLYKNGSLFSTLTLDENGVLCTEDFDESTSILTVGKYNKDFDLVGIWELKNYSENGVDKTFTFTQTIEFKADGTLIFTASDEESGVINGTYSIVGNAIKVYEEDELIATLSLVNGRLLLTQTDSSITYVWAFTQKITIPANGVVGTWDCIKYEINGVAQTTSVIYTFNADGTLTLTTVGDTYNGTYTFSNGTVTATCSGATHVLTLNAQGYLVETDQVETITFQKRSDANAISGTWTCKDAPYCYVFNTDGTFTVIAAYRVLYGTYTLSGNDVTMTAEGNTQKATLNAQGKLVDGDYLFEKQSTTTSLADVIVGTWIDVTDGDISYKFNADGSVTLTIGTISYDGTYEILGDTVIAMDGGDTYMLTLNAQGKLVDGDYLFEKQSSTPTSNIVGIWTC